MYAHATIPYDVTGALDFHSVKTLVEFYLERNSAGIFLFDCPGADQGLSAAERLALVKAYARCINGRVPLFVRLNHGTDETHVADAAAFHQKGATGFIVAANRFDKDANRDPEYVHQVLRQLDPGYPVCLQMPYAAGKNNCANIFQALIDEFPQIAMVVLTGRSQNLFQTACLPRRAEAIEPGRRVLQIIGDDGLFFPENCRAGADGIVTGFAFPEAFVEFWNRSLQGRYDEADDLFNLYLPLLRYENWQETRDAVRRLVLQQRGVIQSHYCRTLDGGDHWPDTALIHRLVQRLEKSHPASAMAW